MSVSCGKVGVEEMGQGRQLNMLRNLWSFNCILGIISKSLGVPSVPVSYKLCFAIPSFFLSFCFKKYMYIYIYYKILFIHERRRGERERARARERMERERRQREAKAEGGPSFFFKLTLGGFIQLLRPCRVGFWNTQLSSHFMLPLSPVCCFLCILPISEWDDEFSVHRDFDFPCFAPRMCPTTVLGPQRVAEWDDCPPLQVCALWGVLCRT